MSYGGGGDRGMRGGGGRGGPRGGGGGSSGGPRGGSGGPPSRDGPKSKFKNPVLNIIAYLL